MNARFEHPCDAALSRLSAALRRRKRGEAARALAMRLPRQIRADIGLSETGELLVGDDRRPPLGVFARR